MIVAAGLAVMLTTCSFVFAYGVYQALYTEMAMEKGTPFTGSTTAQINLIGTLAIAVMSLGGPFAMAWSKQFSPQVVIVAGGWVFGAAYVLASFGQQLWHFALTQGLLLGVGTSLAYVPTMSVAPTWFDKRRGLAMGVIISGTGVGGMFWPPTLRAIITLVGFRNALRISGCVSLVVVSAAGSVLAWEPRFREEQIRGQQQARAAAAVSRRYGWLVIPLVSWKLARSRRFIAQALGNFLQSAAFSTPLFFYVSYAKALGYSDITAETFLTISNAANFVSRIVIGWGADKYGRINALAATTLLSTVAVLGFWLPSMFCGDGQGSGQGSDSGSGAAAADGLFIAFTALYGAFASAYISLFPASLIELFGKENFTNVNGALYLVRGAGALLGTPLIGLLISEREALVSSETYGRAGVTCGVLLFAATAASIWVRIEASVGSAWRWKR